MTAETIDQNDVKTYVQVSALNGSYYYTWVSATEATILVQDHYRVSPAKCAPRSHSPRRQVTLASTEDHISDICFMLAHSIFEPPEDDNGEFNDSDHYANGLRMALETLIESLGQRLLEPPTKATQGLLDMWTRRMVQKFHTYDVIAAKRKNGMI